MLPFWFSIGCLSVFQGVLVAAPARALSLPPQLRRASWALIPAASIPLTVFGVQAAHQAATALSDLALVAVPPGAAIALAYLVPRARPRYALAVAPLFALAWTDRHGLAGEAAAALLTALSCVTLAILLAAVTPRRWLVLGIVAMSALDIGLVISDLLQPGNGVLNRAAPPAGLPQLQRLQFGSAQMGFGDVFVAAAVGAVLVGTAARRRGALVATVFALLFDLLFFVLRELPATVPLALTLIAFEGHQALRERRSSRRREPERLGRERAPAHAAL